MLGQSLIIIFAKFNLQKLFALIPLKLNSKINIILVVSCTIYSVVSVFMAREVVKNDSIETLKLKNMFLSLGELSPDINETKMKNILQRSEDFNEKMKVIYFYGYDKLGLTEYLKLYISNYNLESNIEFDPFDKFERKITIEELKTIITTLSMYTGKKRLNNKVISDIHKMIMDLDKFTDRLFLNNLILSDTIFTDYCAAELLFHHFDKDFQEEFLIKHHKQIRFEMVKTGFGSLDEIPKAYLELINEKTED